MVVAVVVLVVVVVLVCVTVLVFQVAVVADMVIAVVVAAAVVVVVGLVVVVVFVLVVIVVVVVLVVVVMVDVVVVANCLNSREAPDIPNSHWQSDVGGPSGSEPAAQHEPVAMCAGASSETRCLDPCILPMAASNLHHLLNAVAFSF